MRNFTLEQALWGLLTFTADDVHAHVHQGYIDPTGETAQLKPYIAVWLQQHREEVGRLLVAEHFLTEQYKPLAKNLYEFLYAHDLLKNSWDEMDYHYQQHHQTCFTAMICAIHNRFQEQTPVVAISSLQQTFAQTR